MTKSKIFLIVCLCFVLGIFLGKGMPLVYILATTAAAIIVGTISRSEATRLIALSLIMLSLGMFLYASEGKKSNIQNYYGQKTEMTVVIVEEPDVRSDKVFLTVRNEEQERLLLTVPRYPEFSYGDAFVINGKITEPAEAKAPGEFSYKNYLSRFDIGAVVYYPQISNVRSGQGNKIKAAIFKIKHTFSNSIDQILSEPQNSFLKGILIGERRGISEDILEQFRVTGTTHLIAISGFNITIIAQALSKVLDRFGRRISFVVSLLAIFAFVVLTGASASVVRAGIMASIGLIALNIGRLYAVTNALALTAVIMLIQNPKILRFDLGFQLSFLALMGLVYLVPIFEKIWDAPKFIKSYLYPTIAAQIFTFPIILYNFGQMSFVAPLTNMLVLPFIPLAMLAGFVTGIAAMVYPSLAEPLAWVSWLILSAILKVVDLTSRSPFSAINTESVPLAIPVICYALILLFFVIYHRRLIWKPKPNA